MSESGAAPRMTGTALVARTVARLVTGTEWARVGVYVRGPLLTLDNVAQRPFPAGRPFDNFPAQGSQLTEEFFHQLRVIAGHDAQSIPRLVLDSRAFQTDFQVPHILF